MTGKNLFLLSEVYFKTVSDISLKLQFYIDYYGRVVPVYFLTALNTTS